MAEARSAGAAQVLLASGGWYIKFYVEHGQVQLVSCHEPDHDMTCADGTIIKGIY